jgi:hypothetical protein
VDLPLFVVVAILLLGAAVALIITWRSRQEDDKHG